jgi:hypothetical protein
MTRTKRVVLISAGVALLFIVSVIATERLFTSLAPGANDFFPRWKGAQLFWREGIDPYSDMASEAIQEGIYGRLAYPDEDQLLFVYPFYTVILLLPLVVLPIAYSWIQAIWLVTVQFTLIGSVLLCLRLVDWRMPVWLLALTLVWSVVFYNSTRTIILGQFTALIFIWLVGALVALKAGRDGLAGFLLADDLPDYPGTLHLGTRSAALALHDRLYLDNGRAGRDLLSATAKLAVRLHRSSALLS